MKNTRKIWNKYTPILKKIEEELQIKAEIFWSLQISEDFLIIFFNLLPLENVKITKKNFIFTKYLNYLKLLF